MDLALVAGGYQQVALAVEGQRPDVLGLRIVKDFRLAGWRYFVYFAVGGRGDEYLILAIDGDGVDFERVEFGQGLLFAGGRNAVELGARAAACVQIAGGVLRQRPEIGGGGIEDFAELRGEGEQAVAAQGKVAERAFLEIGIIGFLPGLGLAGWRRLRQQGKQRRNAQSQECGDPPEIFAHSISDGFSFYFTVIFRE